jgi:hypothetical protein
VPSSTQPSPAAVRPVARCALLSMIVTGMLAAVQLHQQPRPALLSAAALVLLACQLGLGEWAIRHPPDWGAAALAADLLPVLPTVLAGAIAHTAGQPLLLGATVLTTVAWLATVVMLNPTRSPAAPPGSAGRRARQARGPTAGTTGPPPPVNGSATVPARTARPTSR